MRTKTLVAVLLVLFASMSVLMKRAQAQVPAVANPSAEKPTAAYRLDFSINEMEDGKKINSRQYSMIIKTEGSNEIKIGTRVPVVAGKDNIWQYVDVGTNIWSRLEDQQGQVGLVTRADISNFATPEQSQSFQPDSHPPLIRQLHIDASTIAVLGKPMLLGSVDDPASKRQFQLEVTVAKLR
jgi:hypothetical protein